MKEDLYKNKLTILVRKWGTTEGTAVGTQHGWVLSWNLRFFPVRHSHSSLPVSTIFSHFYFSHKSPPASKNSWCLIYSKLAPSSYWWLIVLDQLFKTSTSILHFFLFNWLWKESMLLEFFTPHLAFVATLLVSLHNDCLPLLPFWQILFRMATCPLSSQLPLQLRLSTWHILAV